MIEYLNLNVYGQTMLIDISSVDTVSQLALVHPVPDNILGLEGVINYRGNGINVVSLAAFLSGRTDIPYSEDDNMVVCGNNENKVCLIVKEACDIIIRDESELHSSFEHKSKIVKGVYVDYNADSWVIDPRHLLSAFSNNTMVV